MAATELHQKTEKVDSSDVLSAKIRLFNLFSPEKLSSDNVDETNVLTLLKTGDVKFCDLQNTVFADNQEIKKNVIDSVNDETINHLCETDLELLKYVYSEKSYTFFNEINARRLIDNKIVEDEALVLQIADRFNFSDILDRFGKININAGYTNIDMILVKNGPDGDFFIGKYPVTQAQWKAVMHKNPSYFQDSDLPVEFVSWYDTCDFINKLNELTNKQFRLPKESEWEFAARGGVKSKGFEYSGSNNIDEVAWYGKNSGNKTHPVGTKKPNELDIYDMSGNVWEWCEYTEGSYRVCRGGSWFSYADYCRVACRDSYTPDIRLNYLGFRLALSVTTK